MEPYKNKKTLKSLDSRVSLISFLSDYYEHDRTSLIFDERLDELEDDVLIIVFIILLYILYFYSFFSYVIPVGLEPTTP